MNNSLRFAIGLVLTCALLFAATAFPTMADEDMEQGMSIEGFVDVEVEYTAASDNKAEIEAGADGTRTYNMTLEWESAGKIVYNAGKTVYSWNSNDLQYDTEVSGKGWTVSDAKITITAKNRSNRPIEMSCSQPVTIDGVKMTGAYDMSTVTIPSAAVNGFEGVGKEQSASVVYTVESVSGEISGNTQNIASISVTVTGK